MSKHLPVIFLAFANEYHAGRYLGKLVDEYKDLLGTLAPISSNENPEGGSNALCELVIRQNASIHDIFDVFQKYEGRIAIFHYAGHADGYQLLLQGKDGEGKIAHGGGLLALLSRKKSLKLVFLNGCSTQKLAQDLAGKGVSTVIGTSASIPDDIAFHLSSRFYKGLALGLTLSGAWEEAKAEVLTFTEQGSSKRGLSLRAGPDEHFPWNIEYKDDASKEVFQGWNLPEVAKQPLYNLPSPKKRKKPSEPFLFLKPYGPEQAEIFFGRSHYIRDLWLKIFEPTSPQIILLYGESGSGKSSLLDAGLRPRLDMATQPDSDELIFDVRYERRRQDLGLVGTLAEILSRSLVQQETQKETLPEDDPNLEKLQQIESLAREMDPDAGSGIIDLVERYRAIQAFEEDEEYYKNLYRKGDLDDFAGENLREAWLQLEKESGRRVVIILDQVEELFTRPNEAIDRELEDLLSVLKDIFDTPAEDEASQIQGKIILGYREEFNAKIEARMKDYELSRTSVFLEHLNRNDIIDVFTGLKSPVVRNFFNISIEDGLPEHVAQTLLKGRESAIPGQAPVAPVLQLLLTKLWRRAYTENTSQPAFTIDAFNQVQSQGKEMEEYFETQMGKVEALKPEAVESGLALDILAFHVSDLNTSLLCNIRDIRRRYRHIHGDDLDQRSEIDDLVDLLKDKDQHEIFLLNDQGRGFTSLPHDTLAPIILREYNRSDKLGQRSARILDTKRPDFIRALNTQEEKKVRLDDNDLEVIEEGVYGMRALEESEQKLLELSMIEREKRRRLQGLLVRGGIVAGLFILFLTVMSAVLSVSVTEQLQEAIVSSAYEQSLAELNQDEEKINYEKALPLAQFAYDNSSIKPLGIVQHYHTLMYAPDAGEDMDDLFLAEAGLEESMGEEYYDLYYEEDAPYMDASESVSGMGASPQKPKKRPLTISVKAESTIQSLEYNPAAGLLYIQENGELVYWPQGDQSAEKTMDLSFVGSIGDGTQMDADGRRTMVGFSADGKSIQLKSGLNAQTVYLLNEKPVNPPTIDVVTIYDTLTFDLFTGMLTDLYGDTYTEDEFVYYYGTDPVLVNGQGMQAGELFSWKLWNESARSLRKPVYQSLKNGGLDLGLDALIPENALEDESVAIPLRATSLSQSTENISLVWNPALLGMDPQYNFEVGRRDFWEEGKVNYFTALTHDRALIVSDGGLAEIRYWDGRPSHFIEMPPNFPNIGITPDQKHLYAVTDGSVSIWDLDGESITGYEHANITDFSFSNDGSSLLTVSKQGAMVWSAERGLATFPCEKEDELIVAHFQGNSHLVLGLMTALQLDNDQKLTSEEKRKEQKKLAKKDRNPRIQYWDLDPKKELETFKYSGKTISNVAVDNEGHYAVAIEPLKVETKEGKVSNYLGLGEKKNARSILSARATIIPSRSLPRSKRAFKRKVIEPLSVKAGQSGDSRVSLSPGGKYIMRLTGGEQVELFNLRGKKVNAFKVEGGFRLGYKGEILTKDDFYLIAHKKDEFYYWHPEDRAYRFADFELSLEEKRGYGLTTEMDYIPGWNQTNKFWAIGGLLVLLIFILFYFSDGIIRLVKARKYRELTVNTFSFLLLAGLLGGLWIAGTTNPVMKKFAFYGIVLAGLAIITIAGLQHLRKQKWRNLIGVAAYGAILLVGMLVFLTNENDQGKKKNQAGYVNAVREVYQDASLGYLAPELVDSFHVKYQEAASTLSSAEPLEKLTDEQLTELAEKNRDLPVTMEKLNEWTYPEPVSSGYFGDYHTSDPSEWVLLMWVMVLILVFGLLIAFPLYRSLSKYRAGKVGSSYLYLFWPIGLVIIGFWGLMLVASEEQAGNDLIEMLAGFGLLILFISILKRTIKYVRGRKWGTFFYYAVPTFLLIGALGIYFEGLYVLGIALAFMEGRQRYVRQAYRSAFAWFVAGLFLAIGALLVALYMESIFLVIGALLLAPGLVILYFGLRQQRRRMAARRASGRRRIVNWLAVFGMIAAGFFASASFAENLYWDTFDDYYYDEEYDDYYYDEETGEYYYPEEASMEEDPVYEENMEYSDTLVEPTYDEMEEEAASEDEGYYEEDQLTEEEPLSEEEVQPEEEYDSPVDDGSLNSRQEQVVFLFSLDEAERDEARRQLSGSMYRDDPEVIPEIIQFSYQNPELHEGIWNALYLLEVKSDDQLRLYRDIVIEYLDWTSRKGYGASTMERIEGIRSRVTN